MTKVIDIEWMLNEIIASYFGIPRDNREKFRDYVMENRSFGFEGKIQIFKRILAEKEVIELRGNGNNYVVRKKEYGDPPKKLKFLQDQRNLLAHCGRGEGKNTLRSWGEPVTFNRKKMLEIIRSARELSAELLALTAVVRYVEEIPKQKSSSSV